MFHVLFKVDPRFIIYKNTGHPPNPLREMCDWFYVVSFTTMCLEFRNFKYIYITCISLSANSEFHYKSNVVVFKMDI